MDRSPGFGSTAMRLDALFRLAFASASPHRLNLAAYGNSQAHYAKGTRSAHSPKAIVLSLLVDTRFQVLFTPLTGVLFTFPSRYWFTIGHQVVFSLGRWSSQIPTGFHVPRGTQVPARAAFDFAYGAITLSGRPFQAVRLSDSWIPYRRPYNPGRSIILRFGLFRVRSPLLGESLFDFFSSGY